MGTTTPVGTLPTPELQRSTNGNERERQTPDHPVFLWLDTCTGLFGGCDGSTEQKLARNEALHSLNYSHLHEHFLESLLREASKKETENSKSASEIAHNATLKRGDSDSSIMMKSINRKRRIPKRLRSQESIKSDEYDSSRVVPPIAPEQFLHDHVRIQKDKGRGKEPGSQICAKGQAACLEKLRVKMRLLCITAIQEKGASMKRRPARVSVHLNNFVETRSILEVRLGFLSMMYGILLRWDTNITGKITLVVLRKMCHESFYPQTDIAPVSTVSSSGSSESGVDESQGVDESPETNEPMTYQHSKEPSAPSVVEGDAIIDWPDGTEVTMLEQPFLISRPENFQPSRLSVLAVKGFNLDQLKGTWVVEFSLDHHVVEVTLTFNQSIGHFVPKTWSVISYDLESVDTALEVTLYQVVSRRRKCAGSMRVPVTNLPIRKDPSTHLSFPCENGLIEIDVVFVSESLDWTQKELEARRQASNMFWSKTQGSKVSSPPLMFSDTDDFDEDDSWSWMLCNIC